MSLTHRRRSLVGIAVSLGVVASFLPVGARIAHAEAPSHYGVSSTIPVGASPEDIASDEASGTLYVTNYNSNTVSVIRHGTVAATVAVGSAPQSVAVDQSDGTAYVSNERSGTVSVIRDDAVVKTITVGKEPRALAVDSVDHSVYVINHYDYSLSVIRNEAVVATLPTGSEPLSVEVEQSSHTAYVTNFRGFSVTVVRGDVVTGTISGLRGPGPVVVDDASATVYVGNLGNDTVSVIKAGSVRDTIPVGSAPSSLAIDESDHDLYVGNRGANSISVIRGGIVSLTIPVGASPSAVAIDKSTGVVYVANTLDQTMSVISDDKVISTFAVPLNANSAAVVVDESTHRAYATQRDTAGVAEIGQVPFTVDRISGADRFAVAVAVSQKAFPGTAPVVFVASGANYPDALGAGPAAIQAGGPVLLTTADNLPQPVASEIGRLKPSTVWVIGGTNSVSAQVQAQISAAWGSATIRRIGGADRYEVSRNVAQTFFPGASRAYVATGANFPDSLSAGSAAGKRGTPIVLVNGKASGLDDASAALLRDTLGVTSITIAGGPESVSNGIESGLRGIASTSRLAGADRFAASIAINLGAFSGSPRVFLATGANFPDALAGSVLAGTTAAPLFVIPGDCVPMGVISALHTLNASSVTLLGGPNSLTERVERLERCTF